LFNAIKKFSAAKSASSPSANPIAARLPKHRTIFTWNTINSKKMVRLKLNVTFIITFLIMTSCNAQINPKISVKDFDKLVGSWQGSLTYLDYSSGNPYTMSADLLVKRIEITNHFSFSNVYPKETSANAVDTITISKDGRYIDKEFVKSRRNLPEGDIEIITEEAGKDGNDHKPATIKHTYTFGKTTYKNRKDVKFAGETEWINRHEYSYTRKRNN
jgi:hypothetical protein